MSSKQVPTNSKTNTPPEKQANSQADEPKPQQTKETAKPKSADDTKPKTTEDVKPKSTEEGKSKTTEDTKPKATENAKPTTTDDDKSKTTEDNKPQTNDQGKPQPTEQSKPQPTQQVKPQPTEPSYKTALRQPAYVIKTFTWKTTGAVEGEGILAQTLKKKVVLKDAAGNPSPVTDAGVLLMSQVRSLVPNMSRLTRLHKFCTPSGTLVSDETITLAQYLDIEPPTEDEAVAPLNSSQTQTTDATGQTPTQQPPTRPRTGAVPSVRVYYRSTLSDVVAPAGAGASAPPINLAMDNRMEPERAKVAPLQALTSADQSGSGRSSVVMSAGQLTEDNWKVVLRNCGVFFGWIVDPKSRTIRRAPRAAFQLRTKDYIVQGPNDSNLGSQANTGSTSSSSPLPDSANTTAPVLDPSTAANSTQSTQPTQSTDTTVGTTAVPQTASVPVDTNAGTTVGPQAPSAPADTQANAPAQSDTKTSASASQRLKDLTDAADAKQKEANEKAEKERKAKEAGQPSTAVQLPKMTPVVIQEKSNKGIPNFRVNDDSKVDITICTHDLMHSFAQNDFSSQSTETSVSGGFGGITAGVSAGFAKSQSKESSNTSTSQESTMVARYKFPRCDLFLYANDLEPTPELQSLLNEIQQSKNINALRRFHREFGQLFCQEVTLGGRLLSTKIMSSTSTESKAAQKESFKVSVGVSVNTPFGGASVKHEQEKGSGSSTADLKKDTQETNVFEAVGGDTIMAKDPPNWSSTVADPNLWRVIERDGLSSLIDMLGQMPGYQKVQSWFVQAVPALSEYITLDSSHEVITRLKLTAPTNSLGLPAPAHYYLGHTMEKVVTPRLNQIKSMDNFWFRIDMTESKVLFNPSTYRAPVIQGFNNYSVGNTQYGASYNKDFASVEWSIAAPFSEELTHGTRVIMKTNPFSDPDHLPQVGEVDNTPPVSQMVVFRNAQGLFVPAMSDRDEFQYWRILKDGGAPGQHIKAGDQVRLCWSFKDQTTGYRDYVDDIFGRRQTTAPPGTPDVLYLKVPWPRFEKSGDPVAMVMSSQPNTENVLQDIQTIPGGKTTYCLQDLKFRIDTVENDGKGDAEDYLLRDVEQGKDITSVSIKPSAALTQVMLDHRKAREAKVRKLRNSIFFFGIAQIR